MSLRSGCYGSGPLGLLERTEDAHLDLQGVEKAVPEVGKGARDD